MELACLDVDPARALGIYDLLGAKIRQTHARLANSLRAAFPDVAERIDLVLAWAPQVLSYGAAYQWATRLHCAIETDDRELFDYLVADFVRFECAAAMLSGQNFVADAASAPHLWDDDAPRGPIVIPLIGAHDLGRRGIIVQGGEIEGKLITPRAVGGMRIEAFEQNYRLARSKSQFNLAAVGAWERAQEEIEAAITLSEQLVPGLFGRYRTDVVPLLREGNISNAGTDEAAPFVVYTSFEREKVDLVACFAHEEAHALINSADKLLGDVLPDTTVKMPVPWKPGMLRSLSNVLHGLISFGRAAQVRTRANAAGLGSRDNDEARTREMRWVSDVSEQLLSGCLGELPPSLREWIESNLTVFDAPPPSPLGREVIGRSTPSASMFPWALAADPQGHRSAVEVSGVLSTGPWHRGSGHYREQDRIDISTDDHPQLADFVKRVVPELIAEQFGVTVAATAVKGHRLRPGDSIRTHSDHSPGPDAFRAVLGVSAVPTDGGLLRLCDTGEQPVIAAPLRFGDCLIFQIAEPCNHDVTELRSSTYRYTVIATYHRVASAG
ncbi:aKG-HExxH-type peptide beta-hydroxylase [Antrihabitans spumae]|uniref:AKG-HExxH-type peptide beta-hydroxylase n=1 Tax=Antrihabitans spumae TaxID=3373370 RepID=A0ABW7KIS4_9NOCA